MNRILITGAAGKIGHTLREGLRRRYPVLAQALLAPGGDHRFGTDQVGRDIFSRVLYGARTSLRIVAVVLALSALVGVPLGIAAGSLTARWCVSWKRSWNEPRFFLRAPSPATSHCSFHSCTMTTSASAVARARSISRV